MHRIGLFPPQRLNSSQANACTSNPLWTRRNFTAMMATPFRLTGLLHVCG
jgi:hypothetical protein